MIEDNVKTLIHKNIDYSFRKSNNIPKPKFDVFTEVGIFKTKYNTGFTLYDIATYFYLLGGGTID